MDTHVLLACIFTASVYWTVSSAPTCINEAGVAVDWYFLYKLPRNPTVTPAGTITTPGLRYIYIDSTSSAQWTYGTWQINHVNSALGRTVISALNDYKYFYSYNDQEVPPDDDGCGAEQSSYQTPWYAHAKGFAAGNDQSGFWLFHSIPRFHPTIGQSFSYPDSGERNAQHIFCTSTPSMNLTVWNYLVALQPQCVSCTTDPRNTAKPCTANDNLYILPYFTAGGIAYTPMAKCNYNFDIYEQTVRQTTAQKVFVQSWRHGLQDTNTVEASKGIKFENLNVSNVNTNVSWLTPRNCGSDHSKWAITTPNANNVCVGDLNRNQSQAIRGGGLLCFPNANLYARLQTVMQL